MRIGSRAMTAVGAAGLLGLVLTAACGEGVAADRYMVIQPRPAAVLQDEGSDEDKPDYEPTCQYELLDLHGWTARVNKRLLAEDSEIGRRALELLSLQLRQIAILVPEPALSRLRDVEIWLDDDPRNQIHYHPERQWLVDNGFNPDRAQAVDLGRADQLVEIYPDQPFVVLHELAHAYHDQVLGFDNPRVVKAYRQAVEEGRYESVLVNRGQRTRHYALTDQMEYFAECTEAFFGTNDFYPFVRAELAEHDPRMLELLERIWLDEDTPDLP